MCTGDDHTCPDFELHQKKLLNDIDCERRSFLMLPSIFAMIDSVMTRPSAGALWQVPAVDQPSAVGALTMRLFGIPHIRLAMAIAPQSAGHECLSLEGGG